MEKSLVEDLAAGKSVNRRILTALKIAVSFCSLLIVTRSVPVTDILVLLRRLDVGIVVVALGVFWIAQIVSSLRCVYIAQVLGAKLSLSISMKAHFVGLWFNQVLPTGLGGDVLKVVILKPHIGLGPSLRSAILDRFSGLFLLMLAISVTLPLYAEIVPREQHALVLGLKALSLGFLTGTVLVAWASTRLRSCLPDKRLLSRLLGLVSDIWLFRKGQSLWRQLWTSLVVHLNGIAAYGLLGVALGFDVNILTFALIVPLVFLVALIPISFAGWGVREAGAIWLFGLVGIPKESALVLSVTYGLLLILAGLPGLFIFIRDVSLKKSLSTNLEL